MRLAKSIDDMTSRMDRLEREAVQLNETMKRIASAVDEVAEHLTNQ